MKVKEVGMRLLSKAVLANVKKEANSACVFLGYQPKMPEKAENQEWISSLRAFCSKCRGRTLWIRKMLRYISLA